MTWRETEALLKRALWFGAGVLSALIVMLVALLTLGYSGVLR